MGCFLCNIFKGNDINIGIEEYKNTPGAKLIDVRTREEYSSGHIPGSVNIPLQVISEVARKVSQKETPVFVYCQSGARSGQATDKIKKMGYTNVKNIGGMNSYKGKVES